MIRLQVNGKLQSLDNVKTIRELLEQLSLQKKRIAVELNQEIVPRSEHHTTTLSDGDKIEIVHAIGGG